MPRKRRTIEERKTYDRERHARKRAADPVYRARVLANVVAWKNSPVGKEITRRRTDFGRLLVSLLKAAPCLDCGRRFPCAVMEFDHRPGTVKWKQISDLAGRKPSRILAEISKCDLVCANCHRLRTVFRAMLTEDGIPSSP